MIRDLPEGTLAAIGIVTTVVVAMTIVQTNADRSVFERYVAGLHPVLVMLGVAAAALVSLPYLASRGWPMLPEPGTIGEAAVLTAVAVPLFLAAAVGADLILRFPEDMNAPLPDALLFYPAIGFLVEVVLHAVPLALLVAAFGGAPDPAEPSFWLMIVPIAMLEAGIQAAFAGSIPTATFSFIQLLAFGAVQLYVFARFGFLPMYAFRLAYYLLWHVGWGTARLHWLF